MRKKQTKGLLKAAEDAKRQEWKGVGAGHIQRHSCVQIGLISLCYKTFFFFNFYSSGELRIGLYCFIKIYMF